MEWTRLLSSRRLGAELQPLLPRPGRSEFSSDIDRIVFSSAFRRLGKKTQVHPLAANDHVHTRLTHSIEVARVGMALGKELAIRLSEIGNRLPADVSVDDVGNIVNAACLAHDLGNPPFGHAGEDAIIHWFQQNRLIASSALPPEFCEDLSVFEGNAQCFRVVTQLENHLFRGGLRLTYATLGTFQKYPRTSRKGMKKFGAYLSEEKLLHLIFSELGIPQIDDDSWCRHPLAFLVEAADDICYAIIDIEDAVELGIINFDEAKNVLFRVFSSDELEKVCELLVPDAMHRVNFARIRGRIFDKVISAAIDSFMVNYEMIMDGSIRDASLFELLPQDDVKRKLIEDAKQVGREKIYNDSKKVEIEIGCYSIFDVLLSAFCGAASDQAYILNDDKNPEISWKSGRILKLLGDHAPALNNAPPGGWTHYQCQRRAIDFVSGMTDNYATYIARQIQGAGLSGQQRP